MLKLILNGTLGADAEVKTVGKNHAINFSVAVNMTHKDQAGNKIEQTEWVKAVVWKYENQSVKIADFLKKGQRVLIEGMPTAEGYKNKEGEIKTTLHINVKDLELLN